MRCVVRVLEPVHPADFGLDVAALREEVRVRIISAKRELDAASSSCCPERGLRLRPGRSRREKAG